MMNTITAKLPNSFLRILRDVSIRVPMVGLAEDSRQLSLARTRLVAADILHEIRIRRVAPKRRSLLRPGTQCSLDLSKRQRKHGLHFSMEKHSKKRPTFTREREACSASSYQYPIALRSCGPTSNNIRFARPTLTSAIAITSSRRPIVIASMSPNLSRRAIDIPF